MFRDGGLIFCQQDKEAIITITNVCSRKAQNRVRESQQQLLHPSPKDYQVTLVHKTYEIPTDRSVIPQRIALAPDFA